jgi:hypothetical protein
VFQHQKLVVQVAFKAFELAEQRDRSDSSIRTRAFTIQGFHEPVEYFNGHTVLPAVIVGGGAHVARAELVAAVCQPGKGGSGSRRKLIGIKRIESMAKRLQNINYFPRKWNLFR